jgi:hypothetical protein
MWVEGFEEGTAHRYIEDLVLDVASYKLSRVLISKGLSNQHVMEPSLQGIWFVMLLDPAAVQHHPIQAVRALLSAESSIGICYHARRLLCQSTAAGANN